jgi:hypothetical protein
MEVWDDFFFVEANASSVRTIANSDAAISGERGADEDDTATVNVVEVSPFVVNRFGGWVTTELRGSVQQEWVTGADEGDDPGNRRETRIAVTAVGGEELGRLGLDAEAYRETSKRLGGDGGRAEADFEERLGRITGSYAVTRSIRPLATIGYADVEIDNSDRDDDLDGLLYGIGVALNTARGDIVAQVGSRYNEFWAEFEADYAIAPRLTLRGNLSRTVDTTLGSVARGRAGNPLDPVRAQVQEREAGQDLDDGVALIWRGQAGLFGDYGRNDLSLVADVTDREFADREETSYGATFTWNRDFSRTWAGRLNLDAAQVERGQDEADYQLYSATAEVSRDLAENAELFTGLSRTDRVSEDEDEEYTEHIIYFGGRIRF